MPGKKKKGKAKGGKKGGDGKLPPPPNLDDTRQGALEALLSFKIHGKLDIIEEYEEDSEVFKDKNYQQKERNHHLKNQQADRYKTLVEQAKKYNSDQATSPSINKESVEEALREKLKLEQAIKMDLKSIEDSIAQKDEQLELDGGEYVKWTNFRDVIQDQNSAKIVSIKETLQHMQMSEAELQDEYDAKLVEAKAIIERNSAIQSEKEKMFISEHLLSSMDENSKAELSDNVWLKKEIAAAKKVVDSLSNEVNSLEYRNLKEIEMVTSERMAEVQNTREIYLATTRKRRSSGKSKQIGIDDGGSLPSLVDIAQCTSEKGPGEQAGQLEMKLLSLRGSKAPFNPNPEMFHLPPLSQQLDSHGGLPPRTNWPITSNMMKSIQ